MSSSIIDASSCKKENRKEPQKVPKEFFFCVFFDGTGNKMNTQQAKAASVRGNGNNSSQLRQRDTNVAALSTLTKNRKEAKDGIQKYYYNIYIEGPGTYYNEGQAWYEKIINYPADKISSLVGSALGRWNQGVIAKVSKSVSMIHTFLNGHTQKDERKTTKLHFNVFGFSRGAACARLFAYLVARAKDGYSSIKYESYFNDYLEGAAKSLYKGKLCFLDDFTPVNRIVEFLGIYDTVSSIGITDSGTANNGKTDVRDYLQYHQMNAHDYGLFSPHLSNVKRTFHICAMDEFRKNFAITDVGKNVPATCIEAFVPGCHSDIGGSYEEDADKTGCLKHTINGKPTKMMMKDPRYPARGTGNVNKENLLSLGWAVEKGFWGTVGDGVTSLFEYDRDPAMNFFQDTISFKRDVKRGLSNITLKMMWQRVNNDVMQVWGSKPFSNYQQLTDFIVPKELRPYANLMDSSKLSYGKRYWIIPGGSLNSESYRLLRSQYIHFSATDRLGTSLVNAPNWKDNLLCRIVYHGDVKDSGVYYIQDYD